MIKKQLGSFIMGGVTSKFNAHKLKKFVDFGFIMVEKVVVKLNKLLPMYLIFYEKMVKNEIALANISKNDNILHIGCGPIPATSILIIKNTKASVTGIDHDKSSVKQADICISKFNFSDKANVKHAEATNFPVQNYDLIIISQGIKPYNRILEYISRSMKQNSRVILRSSSADNIRLSKNDVFLKDIFTIKKIIAQKQNGSLISILLNKKS